MNKSHLEDTLARQIEQAGTLRPVREYRLFAELAGPGRGLRKRLQENGWKDYRYDFAWPEQKLLAEVQGGIWLNASGHNTGVGLVRDYEKNNMAVVIGWRVLHFSDKEIRSGEALNVIVKALQK